MRLPMIGVLLLGIASPAASVDRATAEERLAKLLAGKTAGAPEACLPRRQAMGFRTVGSRLVFRYGASLVYVNQTRGGCNAVGPNEAIVLLAGTSRVCEGDAARVMDLRTGMESGACNLGPFVTWRK